MATTSVASQTTVAVVLAVIAVSAALDNGIGLTPAMGYNSWNDFRCKNISAVNIKLVADKMESLGLAKLGYEYLNIDDCWCTSRDSNGVLVPDPKAFPNGMKDVSDYVHSKGFKFGIYTDRGTLTCAGRPASQGHEEIDAKTFAEWGVDYLKEDSCHATGDHDDAFKQYGAMRDALNATGRPIYFSLCGWNSWYAEPGYSLGNSWRIAGDCNLWPSVWNAISVNEALAPYAKPGGWNDPDMLVGSSPNAAVHNSEDQSRTQFNLWSVMAAPLLIGSNILSLSDWDQQTYTNAEVIAVDQDSLGIQGTVIQSSCPKLSLEEALARAQEKESTVEGVPSCQQIWAKQLADKSRAVIFVNYANEAANVTCDAACFSTLGFQSAHVRDLNAHTDLGMFTTFTAALRPDGHSEIYKFSSA